MLKDSDSTLFAFVSCKTFKMSESRNCQEPNNHPVPILTVFTPQYSGHPKEMLAHIIFV